MKIDHLVVNIDAGYQNNPEMVLAIQKTKLEYAPQYGKGTKGFKASNIWIGDEYFELINILNKDGGGWVPEWTQRYLGGHRGLLCLMLDVDDLDNLYNHIKNSTIAISKPAWLEFKWFFNLFSRKMPWRNSYIPFFKKIPLQLGFQQMKDQKSREFMRKYMQPNSNENGVEGIREIYIYGEFVNNDFLMLDSVFNNRMQSTENGRVLHLENNQNVHFITSDSYKVVVHTASKFNLSTTIENIEIQT